MKTFILLNILVLGAATISTAQFTGDPANPLVLCAATGTQRGVTAFSDNNGGYYAFWIDERGGTGIADVYGQHLKTDGTRKWEADGRLVASGNGASILGLKAVPWQSGILLAWIQTKSGAFTDSLFCQYVDTSGNPIWSKPTLVDVSGNGILGLDLPGFNIFPNSVGAVIGYSFVYTGGAEFFSFNRVGFAGALRWPLHQFSLSYGSYYNYLSASDGKNGLYLLYKGNGLGSSMAIQHFDSSGTGIFSTPLVFTTGTAGFGGTISMHSDATSNLYVTWDSYNDGIYMTKITPHGSFAWSSPTYRDVSTVAVSQANSYSILDKGKIFTVWNDGRTGASNSFIYIQKTDTSGINEWTPGGVQLSNLNSYIPTPKVVASDSGSVVATYETSGFYGQKLRADSTPKYPVNGKLLVESIKSPFYGEYVLAANNNGCVAVFWTNNNDVQAAELCNPVSTAGITSITKQNIIVYPNPTSTNVEWNLNSNEMENSVSLTDIQGRIIYSGFTNNSSGAINISKFPKGIYLFQIKSNKVAYSTKLFVE